MPRRQLAPAVATLAALALCAPAAASANACASADLLPAADNLTAVSRATLCLLNQQRAASGVAPLTENARLTIASTRYSQRMLNETFFAHEAPDGLTLVDRLKAAGYAVDKARAVGENLGWGSESLASARSMVRAWMASPGHRANLLRRDYTEVGLGVVVGTPDDRSSGATYTTDFGSRAAAVHRKASRTRRSRMRAKSRARIARVRHH